MSVATLDQLGLKYGTDKASSGHNYLYKYEPFLSPFRDDSFTFVEIGGLNGASLKMWEEFFPKAKIVCLDINPEVKKFDSERITVEIGNSGNPAFLKAVMEKHGPARIIVDDGSHRWDHMAIAFRHLYPALERSGVYIVEDIHTNYEGRYAGESDLPFTRVLHDIVDLMSARGEARKGLIAMTPKYLTDAAATAETVTFMSRSCVIKKIAAKQ